MRASGVVVAVALGASVLGASSCKKTVEGENKNWAQNQQHAQELIALYPGFAGALREQVTKAEAAMAAAKGAPEKEAATKMAEANSLLSEGFVYNLGQLDGKMKRLRDRIVTASMAAEHGGDQIGAKAVADDAQRVLRNADDALKAGAADATAASTVLRKIDDDLSSATANVERIIDSANKRKQQAATPPAGSSVVAPGAVNAPPVKVTWKCTYCGQINDESAKKCVNCGAPHTAPGAPKPGPAKPAPGAKPGKKK